MMENLTGMKITDNIKDEVSRGAEELDLVRSGLDDTMRTAYQQIRNTFEEEENIHDFRTAAYVTSIRKIARSYIEIGLY